MFQSWMNLIIIVKKTKILTISLYIYILFWIPRHSAVVAVYAILPDDIAS